VSPPRIDYAAALEFGVDVNGRRVFLHGDVSEDTIGRVIRGLYLTETQGKGPIQLFVSSYGGALDDAFGLHDVTRTITCPVHTIALGKCHSAAPLLIACGHPGQRWSGPHTSFMLHDVTLEPPEGSPVQVAEWVEDARRLMRQYAKLLANYTDRPAKHWAAMFNSKRDRFFGAEEAQEWGLIDHIWDEKE